MEIFADLLRLIAYGLILYVGVVRFFLKTTFHSLRQMPAGTMHKQLSESFEPLVYKQLNGLTKKDFMILIISVLLGVSSTILDLAQKYNDRISSEVSSPGPQLINTHTNMPTN